LKFGAWEIHSELQGTTKRMKIGETDEMDFDLLAIRSLPITPCQGTAAYWKQPRRKT
jgi:hypothetical protein